MRILLDTHVLLWALSSPGKLPTAARRMIDENEVFVSAASIWEITIKSALGKLRADPSEVMVASAESGFQALSITHAHAAEVSKLPGHHRDPFDRLLIAQASVEPLTLLTRDTALSVYGAVVRVV
jgi:PIN domain nuclease of toxin-antitoxin system